MRKTKFYYDKHVDALYINLKKGEESYFEEVQPNVTIEYNDKKEPIGIEILNATSILREILPKTNISLVHEKNPVYKTSSK